MDSNLNNFGNRLQNSIVYNDPTVAENLILQVLKEFEDTDLSVNTIDAYLLNIFNSTNGILPFFIQVLHRSNYKKVKERCLELLETIINNCLNKVQEHLLNIIETIEPVGRSSASAAEKKKSLALIALIILKGDFSEGITAISNLYKKLFQLLNLQFDKSDTAQEQLLKAIGTIAKKYPVVIDDSSKLLDVLVFELNKELNKPLKQKSFLIITGCISALSDCFENFEFSSNNSIRSFAIVYNSLKILADTKDETRKVAHRESLQFLAKHSFLFKNNLYLDAQWWHEILLNCFNLKNEKENKVLRNCLDKFYIEIVYILSIRNDDYDQKLFKYFLTYFEACLESLVHPVLYESKESVDSYKIQSDIFGLGIFSQSFKLHISGSEVDRIFFKISQLIENMYILKNESSDDEICNLPLFVQTLSFIIRSQPQLHSSHVLSLERLHVVLIKVLPKLIPTQHYLVAEAFLLATCQMKQSLSSFEIFLEGVIYQGIIWTCSHETALEAEIYKEKEVITYKNYMHFWNEILNIKNFSKYEKYSIDGDTLKNITKSIFKELLKTLFVLIHKLNLGTKLKDEHTTLTSIEVSYEAIQTNDFVIFINLTDFYQDILERIDIKLFEPFVVTYINQILSKSAKFPVVSGFYKLLVCGLKICDNLNFFKNQTLTECAEICYYSLQKFLQNILWKIKEYKGDLQIACIHVILSSPVSVIREIIPLCAAVFIILFDIGHSYLKLANLGIDTLEKWYKVLSQEEIEPLLKEVLPSLDTYLRSKSIETNTSSFTTTKFRKTAKAISKRKILVKSESELFKLKVKILKFLGQINNNLCLSLLKWDNNDDAVLNKTSYLKVLLPFKEFRTHLYLDQFVPRIVELALYSSNRRIRVFACELLHSVVMIFLGTAYHKHQKQLEDLEGLSKIIIKTVLKLGCDVDQVIQQLFSLLAIQLMHYYSHPSQMQNSHAQIVIEALSDAVSHSTDSSLRDFAGKCIKEFVTWTIKQRKKSDLLKHPIDIKVWIRIIHSFSLHPDSFKRLGATVIFNNTYTILREETHMFNMFWLELLYSFVINLSLTGSSDGDYICKSHVLLSLDNIMRGLVEKYNLFNNPDNTRRIPYELDGNLLKDVGVWLLKKTGSTNPSCREKCMSMFCRIAPLVPNCNNSPQKFIEIYAASNNVEWIYFTYESELLKNETVIRSSNIESIVRLFEWMQGLQCALDGYIFVYSNKFITGSNQTGKSKFFMSLQYFLESIQTRDISEISKFNGEKNMLTLNEKYQFKKMKTEIVHRILKFLTTILKNKCNISYIAPSEELFWNNNLWSLICNRIFDATLLGFEVEDCGEDENILIILNQLPVDLLKKLINFVSCYISSNNKKYSDLNIQSVTFKQRQLMNGILILQKCNLVSEILEDLITSVQFLEINLSLLNSDNIRETIKLTNSVKDFCTVKLEISLQNEIEFVNAVEFMCNSSTLIDIEKNCQVEYGFFFFKTFKETLLKNIFKYHIIYVNHMFKHKRIDHFFKYLKELEEYIKKHEDSSLLQSFVDVCVTTMDKYIDYFDAKNVNNGLDFLNMLLSLSREYLYNLVQDKPSIVNWMINLLQYEDKYWTAETVLNFKSYVLCLLPWIIGPFNTFEQNLRIPLDNLKITYFNNISKSDIGILTTFKKFLNSVKRSTSSMLLLWSIDIYIRNLHISKQLDNIQPILKDFILNASEEQQTNLLSMIYEYCFNFGNYTDHQRYTLAKEMFPTLLHNSSYIAFEKFYVIVMPLIKLILNTEQQKLDKHETVNKTIAYILIENLFSKIKTENFETNECPISKAFLGDCTSESKLVKNLIKIALNVCKEHYDISTQEEKEILRLYQCHTYNAISSIITNTCKELLFYRWLFKREDNKKDVLWNNLIDIDKNYTFDTVDTVPSMSKRLVNIRNNIRRDDNIETVNYLNSQVLFSSTLGEDVTKFDLSNALVRSQNDHIKNVNEKLMDNKQFVVELSVTSINVHECMPTICAVIRHIVNNNIIDDKDIEIPSWMEDIRNTLMIENTHINIKLFLITVIKNTENVFKPYAKWFLKPLLKFIVSGAAGTTLNVFIGDLLEMIVLWSRNVTVENEIELASELLKFLMTSIDYDIKSAFKYNLEFIKLIIENWGKHLIIPYDFFLQELQMEPNTIKKASCIQLIAVVLANNIAPWRPNEMPHFLKSLVKLLKNDNPEVYKPCAETIAMCLQFLSRNEQTKNSLNLFSNILDKYLKNLNENKFINCLEGICLHYPEGVDKQLCRVIERFNHVVGTFKNSYLNVLMTRVEVLNSINELSSIDFKNLLSEQNIGVQLKTLEFIQKAIPYLKESYVISLLEDIVKFINSFNTACRSSAFNIFIVVYSTYCSQNETIIKICKDALLQGLIDSELTIQEKIYDFWSNVGDIPMDIGNRIIYILNNLYNSNTEEHFIGYSIYLIINLMKNLEEYSEKIFEYTLYDCTFEEYNLTTNWRMQHISTAPLFVNSLRSQQLSDTGSMDFNVLRASVENLEFQPTQMDNNYTKSKSTLYSSSLMFNVNKTIIPTIIDDGVFKCPSQMPPKTQYNRRLAEDKLNRGRYYANLEVKKSLKIEEQRRDRVKELEQNVIICRKYRKGDYPDIEISLSSVLFPLQMLARHDTNLARNLYTSLFASVVDKIEIDTFFQKLTSGITSIFNNSSKFSANTMATFLEIILDHRNDLRFDPSIITNICQSSGLYAIGSLILEEYIALEDEQEGPPKRLKGVETGKNLHWIKFAELHKNMEEWDIVNSIFINKIDCHPIALKAIEAESNNDWRLAEKYYADVLQNTQSTFEQKDFYCESYFKCIASLAEWDSLPDCIEKLVSHNSQENLWSALWDDAWNQEKLLPWYIKSNLRRTLVKEDNTLFSLINASLKEEDKLEYLKYNFGEEIAMLWLHETDFNTANFYLNCGITRVLENWLHLNPRFFLLRANKLLNIQSMMEIYSFVNDVSKINVNNKNCKDLVAATLKCWDQTYSGSVQTLMHDETKTIYRNQFLSSLISKLPTCEVFEENDSKNIKFNLYFNLIEKAIEQENYIVARTYIKICPRPHSADSIENIRFQLSISKILYLKAHNSEDKLSEFLKSFSQLKITNQDSFEDNKLCYFVKSNEHAFDIIKEIYKILLEDSELFKQKRGILHGSFKGLKLNSPESLFQFGITNLKNSLHQCENQINNMMNSENLKVYNCMANAYLKIAYAVQDNEDFTSMFIVSVLRAMKLGSIEGRQLFPCLLSRDIGGSYREIFDSEAKGIPIWLFLGWIPQLLAIIDTSKVFSLSNILINIATAYPQAIKYAFQISKEKYVFKNDEAGRFGNQLIHKLNKLCHDSITDNFLKALASVADPSHILTYYLNKLYRACNIEETFKKGAHQLLNEVYYEKLDNKNATNIRGNLFKHIEKYEKQVKTLVEGSFNSSSHQKEIKKMIDELKKKKVKSSLLVEYSPWLANFQALKSSYELEIPGQYTGEKLPLINYHTKINGFLSQVTPITSIRNPVKLTILGNDGKEYPFLVKFGEDIRQDQRIQQIFGLMNNILFQDQQCSKRQLAIDTYKVIPLSSNLGIIEWISNTMELIKFIGVDEKIKKKGFSSYISWLHKACPGNENKSECIQYRNAYIKYNRHDTIENFRSLVTNTLPANSLRKAIWSVSFNSEHFFTIRQKFIQSYSVMCISNWLLGIGDRHLSNILISTKNGRAIGIDFGHAFGTATQLLPIPELVPFRLTPQILNLLQPLNENDLVQKTMIHSLKALRKKSYILLATMNVFIQEPSLDWLEYSRNHSKIQNNEHDIIDEEWYPLEKIQHAKRKLEGENSVNITVEELKAGHSNNTLLLNACIEVLKGLPEENFRTNKKSCLSVEDQVKCLLDHATDHNILGRMYVGWQAWI